jgi:predicted signal transduction protein with EAL and GGDEF domain
MTRWLQPVAVVLVWGAALAVNARYGTELGAYASLTWAVAVGITGVAVGAWIAVLLGAVVGTLVGFGVSFDGASPRLASLAIARGRAAAAVGTRRRRAAVRPRPRILMTQFRHHRGVSDRAQYDVLTGVLNRRAFERRLDEWIRSPRGGEPGFALLFVDLDRFKFVNDTFGHAVGDQLLIAVARS